MSSAFEEKRESLVKFLSEQLIGPGAYNNKYHFKENIDNLPHYEQDLKGECTDKYFSEIIPEVPAYQYSTAILFPKIQFETVVNNDENIENEVEEIVDNEEITNRDAADDEEITSASTDNLIGKQQNYPSDFGLSFVIPISTNISQDLNINFSFRKYYRNSKRNIAAKRFSILITEYQEKISDIVNQFFSQYLLIFSKGVNKFITFHDNFSSEELYNIDYINYSNFIKNRAISLINSFFGDNISEIRNQNGLRFFGLAEENTTFYTIGTKEYNGAHFPDVASLYHNTLIDYIKKKLKEDALCFAQFDEIIEILEISQQLKAMIEDFKSLTRKRNSTPIWHSINESINITLPEYNGGRVQRVSSIPLSDTYPSLKFSVQYLKVERREGLYVKIIIENDNSVKRKEGESVMLNKNDEANEKSFFGIALKILETNNGVLLPYNSPQFIEFDEEDNFSKLLYRNFKDYGEGYNTSITWGLDESSLRFVSTEFLPEEETPKVDFKPSKIVDGEIVSRIPDDNILSMRNLSTFSVKSDEKIIEGLNEFIDSYNEWIDEKNLEAQQEENNELLLKQIKACTNDYQRLKRNITLLAKDNTAMVAFRLMNSAMFMQLHHSILKKTASADLQNTILDEEYYRNINIQNDYKWRSFQLAFILLNVDAFVKPDHDDKTVKDVFGYGWPERNEIADLVWFPTGGGKTEAYLGIIAFLIAYRRFTKGETGNGTAILMRYTLRLLTLQQFQRATLLICALEVFRKKDFSIPFNLSLGNEKITIGLFVGGGSLPNRWAGGNESMLQELTNISQQLSEGQDVITKIPFTDCPWCGSNLFVNSRLNNIRPNHENPNYGINNNLNICCHNSNCVFHFTGPHFDSRSSLPMQLFDEDIYKFPPTLLFGTVDKFAALANNVSTNTTDRYKDSRRFFGSGSNVNNLPPELIIQDELHLLLGPLGTAVGLFEKSIDFICTYKDSHGNTVKPKIITSTATTRNTDKQIFALFNRRSEIFPKQGITADDSFFAYYERSNSGNYIANRKYVGVFPVGKTQVWMQLRVTSISLAHRLLYLKEKISLNEIFSNQDSLDEISAVADYYQTVLSYFNSLKEVGKTQSQLSHYLPGDVNFIIKNVLPWSFMDKITRNEDEINYSELTGRLSGEEVKTNLSAIEKTWELINNSDGLKKLNADFPPDYVISTNMISVGIDISRFNTMIISSMPRNIAEYIQASSRVARNKEGLVLTVHHPFRSRDISHYQRFKEFHEKFYSYVEPISVTPFATKALDRYLAMYLAVIVRHNTHLELVNNIQANNNVEDKITEIREIVRANLLEMLQNANSLNQYLQSDEKPGIKSNIEGIIHDEEFDEAMIKIDALLNKWINRIYEVGAAGLKYNNQIPNESLFIINSDNTRPNHWKVGNSLRELAPETVIKTVQQ